MEKSTIEVKRQVKKIGLGKKVAVAMSGGVDSSVVAWMLKQQGYEVEGFFLRLKFPDCALLNWRESEGRAYLAAKTLGIPIHTLNFSQEFQQKVWNPFWRNYRKGLTANPCPTCNPQIKFGSLLRKVCELGFDYLATGHYVRLERGKNSLELKRGVDGNKDQSYFLYRLLPASLPFLKFPLGDFKKDQIKKMAQKIFPNRLYRVSESQGLCFAQGEEFKELAQKILPQKTGIVRDEKGQKVGEHRGVWFFTEGQRSGIGNIYSEGKPLYVVKKDQAKNEIIVTNSVDSPSLYSKFCLVQKINWLEKSVKKEFTGKVQIRYGSESVNARIKLLSKQKVRVIFDRPQRAITPGQSAVFYRDNQVLGGGEITIM